jgi:hypothetical protein
VSIDAVDGGASSLKECHVLNGGNLDGSNDSGPDGGEFSK